MFNCLPTCKIASLEKPPSHAARRYAFLMFSTIESGRGYVPSVVSAAGDNRQCRLSTRFIRRSRASTTFVEPTRVGQQTELVCLVIEISNTPARDGSLARLLVTPRVLEYLQLFTGGRSLRRLNCLADQ